MKKRLLRLAILVCALGVLIGGYFLIAALTKDDTETAVTPPLLSVAADDLKTLAWTYNNATVSLTRADDGTWSCDGAAAFPLDQDQVTTMTGVLQNMTATLTIDDPADLSEYGFDQPQCVIDLTKKDGTALELKIGDYNAVASAYYFETPDGVYAVSSAVQTAFCKTLCDLAVKETVPDFQNVTAVAVSDGQQTHTLEYVDAGDAAAYSGAFRWFEDGDRAQALSPDRMDTYLTSLTVTFSKCVDWNANDTTLSTYGLGANAASVTVTYGNGQTFKLWLGSENDAGRFARIDGSGMVYLVASADADALLAASYDDLKPDRLLSLDWDEVTAFDVTAGGQTVTLIADADSGWLCRGVALETTLSDNLKNALTGLTLSTDAAGTPAAGAQTVVIAVYQDRTGWEQLDLTLTETDAGWLASFNGQNSSVSADAVTALTSAVQAVTDSFSSTSVPTTGN